MTLSEAQKDTIYSYLDKMLGYKNVNGRIVLVVQNSKVVSLENDTKVEDKQDLSQVK